MTFLQHGSLQCYFFLTLEALVCTQQMNQGLKQGISLEMSPALSLNWLRTVKLTSYLPPTPHCCWS